MWVWNSNRKWWLCQCTTESKGKGPWKLEQLESGENFCTCHESVPSTARHMSFRRLTCHCHSIHTLNSYAHTLFQHVGEGRLIDSYHMPGKETQRRASFLSSKLGAPLVRQVQLWETNWNSARGDLARTELLLGRGEQLIVWVIGSPGRKCESHLPWKRHAAFWKLLFWSCLFKKIYILLRKSQSLHLSCQGEGYLPAPGKQFEIPNWKSWYVIVCPVSLSGTPKGWHTLGQVVPHKQRTGRQLG